MEALVLRAENYFCAGNSDFTVEVENLKSIRRGSIATARHGRDDSSTYMMLAPKPRAAVMNIILPSSSSGVMSRSTASYTRMPVNPQIKKTDSVAPMISTSNKEIASVRLI